MNTPQCKKHKSPAGRKFVELNTFKGTANQTIEEFVMACGCIIQRPVESGSGEIGRRKGLKIPLLTE